MGAQPWAHLRSDAGSRVLPSPLGTSLQSVGCTAHHDHVRAELRPAVALCRSTALHCTTADRWCSGTSEGEMCCCSPVTANAFDLCTHVRDGPATKRDISATEGTRQTERVRGACDARDHKTCAPAREESESTSTLPIHCCRSTGRAAGERRNSTAPSFLHAGRATLQLRRQAVSA